jgi:hypothetical protein
MADNCRHFGCKRISGYLKYLPWWDNFALPSAWNVSVFQDATKFDAARLSTKIFKKREKKRIQLMDATELNP